MRDDTIAASGAAGRTRGFHRPAKDEVAGALSPVPGGIGPVTTAMLLRQMVEAAAGGNSPG